MIRHNAGSKIIFIPGDALRATHPASAAIIPWYLSGGISAANCIAAYQPKGAADLAGSYVNLANPGAYNCSVFTAKNAPSFSASTGWTFNGSDQGLTTGVVPNQNYSFVIRYSDAVADNGFCFGVETGTAVRFHFYPKYTDNNQYFRASGNYSRSAPADFAAAVAGATKDAAYWNGSNLGSVTGDYSGTTLTACAIGVNPESATILWPGKVQALAIYNTTLSDAQMLALYTAMAAL